MGSIMTPSPDNNFKRTGRATKYLVGVAQPTEQRDDGLKILNQILHISSIITTYIASIRGEAMKLHYTKQIIFSVLQLEINDIWLH